MFFHRVDGRDVHRIDHRDPDHEGVLAQGGHLILGGEFAGQDGGQGGIDRMMLGVVALQMKLVAQHLDNLLFVHDVVVDEIVAQFQARSLLGGQGLGELFGGEQPFLDQHVAEAFTELPHWRLLLFPS